MIDQLRTASQTRAVSAMTATVSDVSIRPCLPSHGQVIATSPGLSASHAAPKAAIPTSTRKRTTRIIAVAVLSLECRDRLGGQCPAGVDGRFACPRLCDPSLRGRGQRRRQLGKLRQRTTEIELRGTHLDARNNRCRLVAWDILDRTHSNELFGARLQPIEKARVLARCL